MAWLKILLTSWYTNWIEYITVSAYLTDELCQVADVEARQRLRSSSSSLLIVSRTRLLTVGDRAFPVAAAPVWNSLPDPVTSAPSVAVFRSRLKTHLFNISYALWLYSACAVTPVALDTIIVLAYLLTGQGHSRYLYTEFINTTSGEQAIPVRI